MIVGGGIVPSTNFTRHEVHRPRPPQVAVTSTPPSCAAFRMLVPAATVSSRRVRASPGSVKMTSETAIRRLALGEPPREQPQRLLAQRRVAAVLGPRLQALAQRLELERLDVSKREDRPKLQPDRRLVAQERAETVEVLAHSGRGRGGAG